MRTEVTADQLVALLHKLELRSRKEAKGLPRQPEPGQYWEGFIFHVAGFPLLASMDEVAEILNQVPPIARVPGAKPWVRGVANLRGQLLPIVDLQQLLGERALVLGRHSRILVVNQNDDNSTGLLVARVSGRRRLPADGFSGLAGVEGMIKPFVEGGFVIDGTEWPVFSLKRLVSYPDYQSAAK